ncbi:antirestriction protein [Pseudomonas sp. RIT-PI-AD]|uniref:antirestriction protein n=1 Tax=Pseudomonas sp. RIT-PI-AD TaxID=3035294 RepID=UPI0021D9D53D|nr:antirestriction protein [Pseudomonas sp. RIT-PI-AD]
MTLQKSTAVSSCRVSERSRLITLPRHFGRLMMVVEHAVMDVMSELSSAYQGGYWEFYELSNGGFYMAPTSPERFILLSQGSGNEGELSADASGIVACLFAINRVWARYQTDSLADHYHWLLAFAREHAEWNTIAHIID